MVPRDAAKTLSRLAKGFPIVAITGPRQAGKTTLAKAVFGDKPYITLENPDEREFAQNDPKRFLARFPQGAILDEIQRCPELLSWLQGWVDDRGLMGDFVLTGSAQLDLVAGITQTLAGRVGRVELLPLSSSELAAANMLANSLTLMLFQGGYPALYSRAVTPQDWFNNYMATYVERDVRQLINVRELGQFQTFVKMCAARTGQLLNLSALGADCGISAVTAKQWLTVLEASYIVALLRPHHNNYGKRLVKTPKLYFLDSGLAAWLLGIRDAQTLETHASRGALFETWVFSELYKHSLNAGQTPALHFWRDSTGNEIDLIDETAQGLRPIEIKSGATYAKDWVSGLRKWQALAKTESLQPAIVYGGDLSFEREDLKVWGWKDVVRSAS
jgi:predicted AAA+ superfamily ATPase